MRDTLQVPLPLRRNNHRAHVIVCGDNPLAVRLVDELTNRYHEEVTVILPSRKRGGGPMLEDLPGVRVVESDRLDEETFRSARLASAKALALVSQDDVGNIHAALRAQELNGDLRLVIRMFHMSLGYRIHELFADCAVLSDAAMAAPAFVAAALGEVAPNHIRLSRRTLYVTSRSAVPANRVVCPLADSQADRPKMLPDDAEDADLVLAIADGSASGTAANDPLASGRFRRRRRPGAALRHWLGALVNRRLGLAICVLVAIMLLGTTLFATITELSWLNAAYVTLFTSVGAVGPDPARLSAAEKVVQTVVTLAGLAMVPVITAAVVDAVVTARLAASLGTLRIPAKDHMVVVGLGDVGSRIVMQMNDLGLDVVAIDHDEHASGVATARRLGVPVIVADASRAVTLRQANVGTSRALLAVTSDDVLNLEAALHGRALRRDLRVVLRLFEDDLATRVQEHFGIHHSRSVSFLAAPAFAAAMTERKVIGTIPVGRRVLLVVDVAVFAGSALDGKPVRTANQAGESRVIALIPGPVDDAVWSPPPQRRCAPGDRLIALTTRAGLSTLIARAGTPAERTASAPSFPATD